ncbi:GNAT family N-acetyltransferase [Kitasatospora sp. NPDC008050]|uniref:GNAT family N-acetyltransferase n=1 Tax=Kitasatospora sp. NPDC008050 TaxID=3364021 RepID=UPI0036EA0B82
MADTRSKRGPEITLWDLVKRPDMGLARDFYDNVLSRCFPPDELMPWEDVKEALGASAPVQTSVTLALRRDREVVGGVAAEWYERSRVLLLSYIAVRPDLQGSGIGSQLREVVPGWLRERNPLLAVGEVEPLDLVAAAAEHGDPERRLRLFSQWQGSVLQARFLQPRLAPDQQRVPLLLIAFHLDPSVCCRFGREQSFSSEVLADFLDEYFTVTEGSRDFTKDPEYTGMLESLRYTPCVRVIPLDEYLRAQRP